MRSGLYTHGTSFILRHQKMNHVFGIFDRVYEIFSTYNATPCDHTDQRRTSQSVFGSYNENYGQSKTIQLTYCKSFDSSCYHHQCIVNWSAVILLQVLIGLMEKNAAKIKNAKSCFGSDVVERSYVVTWLSWIHADGDGAWRHEWGMKLCYHFKMHRGIDGMFTISSVLCSWINKDSRICSRRQLLSLPMTSGLWKSTRWSGLVYRCLHTEELSDVRCSSIRFIKLLCVCPTQEAPHEHISLYTTLDRFSKPISNNIR